MKILDDFARQISRLGFRRKDISRRDALALLAKGATLAEAGRETCRTLRAVGLHQDAMAIGAGIMQNLGNIRDYVEPAVQRLNDRTLSAKYIEFLCMTECYGAELLQ